MFASCGGLLASILAICSTFVWTYFTGGLPELRKHSKLASKQHVLLCKACNDNAGDHGDKHIQTAHQLREARETGRWLGTPEFVFMKGDEKLASVRGTLTPNEDSLTANLEILRKTNKPSEFEALQAVPRNENFTMITYDPHPHPTELAQVGLITTGYLLAFYTFGYRYIFQEAFDFVREYILASFKHKNGPPPELPNLSIIEAFAHKEKFYPDPLVAIVIPFDEKISASFQVSFLNYIVRLPFQCILEAFETEFPNLAPQITKSNDIFIPIRDSKISNPEWVWDKVLGTFPITFFDD